jgi:phosphoglucosamine mutase
MISASHNVYSDNGIKIVNRSGEKIDDRMICLLESYLDGDLNSLGVESEDLPLATGGEIGAITDYVAGRNRYVGYLISLAAHSFRGLRIGLDCANGSSWMIARSVFEALGAKVYVINDRPNGLNINVDCGSTHIEGLQAFVREKGLDAGFAFDGDADRCLAVDERGELLTGDHIIFIMARRLKDKGALAGNTAVSTVMSNIGLYRALEREGISSLQTTVGDRFIFEAMQKHGYQVGGEQSGHIILKKYGTAGDGILTAIKLVEEMLDRKMTLSKLAAPVVLFPQYQESVRVKSKEATVENEEVCRRVREIEAELNTSGRILLRRSGTEPVVRVMVEAETEEDCRKYVQEMIALIRACGLGE